MWKNDTFNDAIEQLLSHRLGKAVKLLENYFLSYPGLPFAETFQLYASHYRLLMDYWQSGYDDPAREKLYHDLLHHFYVLTGQLMQWESNSHSSYRLSLRKQALQYRKDWSVAAIRDTLEEFVSDVAMLSLEPEHVQQVKKTEIYERHQLLMRHLFAYIWTSQLWNTADAEAFQAILLSPTIDSVDQQLLVSVITMSALNVFDIHKFKTLTEVYRQTADEQLRQRALVGWVLAADANMARLYEEVGTIVGSLCENERCREELTELQMQMAYCMDAEADTRRIQDEIMPELLSHSNFKITRHGIVETEDDSLEDILHPDAAEQNMEKMEESMKKMANMQQQGADIYFGGFSQMKRFPFFEDVSNWFVPFYPEHPGISHTWNQSKGRKFLHLITKMGAFCDSDKYSFVLAFDKVIDRMPKSILSMIEQGEAIPTPVGGEIASDEQNKPAFMRRVYLQNLYRFFKLFAMRSEFRNPFGDKTGTGYLFFLNPLFRTTSLQSHYVQIVSFFMKRKRNRAALQLLQCCSEASKDFQFYMMMGTLLQREPDVRHAEPVSSYFRKAANLKPDNERALSGLARALFGEQLFTEALAVYDRLLLIHPDNLSYELGSAVCLLNMNRIGEALQKLYRLSYNNADNVQVMRSLAWALTVNGKYEQAGKMYDQLLAMQPVQPADILNYGYCLWFQRKNREAADAFRKLTGTDSFDFEREFWHVERQLLAQHDIKDTEIWLMLDQLAS